MPYKIVIVGEAWGDVEAQYRRPFVGPAGQELDRILADAGLSRADAYLTNVFNFHPERNNIETLCCGPKDPEVLRGRSALLPGKYLRAEFEPELTRLMSELDEIRPNLVIALGNTASWALLDETRISKHRGTVSYSKYLPWLKVLPAYHPAAVLRQFDLRHVTVVDFQKAKAEAEFPEIRRPKREIWYEPTLDDIRAFAESFITPTCTLAIDIETAHEQITCIGFAPTIDRALVIPFVDPRKPAANYWPTLEHELAAWAWIDKLCQHPSVVGQNFLYDVQYLWMKYGIAVPGMDHDSMLLHHSIFPESEKGLAFLGSVYTNESSWKEDRARGKHTIKRED